MYSRLDQGDGELGKPVVSRPRQKWQQLLVNVGFRAVAAFQGKAGIISMFARLKSKIHVYNKTVYTLILMLSVSFLLLTFLAVVNRYFLRQPIPWSMEILKLLFVWLIFIAGSAGVERDSHVAIKWLEYRLSASARRAIFITNAALVMCFLLVMLVAGSTMTWVVYTTGQVTSYLRESFVFWYAAVPGGFALMIAALLIRVFG